MLFPVVLSLALFMLAELRDQLAARGVDLALAGKRHLIEEWRRSRGIANDGSDGRTPLRLFSTLDDAVEALVAEATTGGGSGSAPR